MAREKKDAKNFACKFDRDIFEKLEEFCEMSGQSKTLVVERAVGKYLEGNPEKMRGFSKKLQRLCVRFEASIFGGGSDDAKKTAGPRFGVVPSCKLYCCR